MVSATLMSQRSHAGVMSHQPVDAMSGSYATIRRHGRVETVCCCDTLASIDPASMEPLDSITAWRDSGPISGAWWSSTLKCNVEVGNQRERDALMLEDFAGSLRRVTSRPMRLDFPSFSLELKPSHLIERTSGNWDLLVVEPIHPDMAGIFIRATGLGLHSPAGLDSTHLVQNVRWLAGFRFSRFAVPASVHEYVLGGLGSPRSIRALCARAASSTGLPRENTLAGVYRMLWDRQLVADLESRALSDRTEVARA